MPQNHIFRNIFTTARQLYYSGFQNELTHEFVLFSVFRMHRNVRLCVVFQDKPPYYSFSAEFTILDAIISAFLIDFMYPGTITMNAQLFMRNVPQAWYECD